MISVYSCLRVRFRCIYVRSDDFSAFMCEGWDSAALTWGMMILVHSCVRGRISVHLPEEWRFGCIHVWGVRFQCTYLRNDDFGVFMSEGKIPVHLPEEWRFQCIHVWGVRFCCIDLRDDDFGAFMCEGSDFSSFTWRVTIWVHSCVRGKIPVHLLEGWRFQCHHVWGVWFQFIYLRSDDFGAFMCEG